MNTQLDFETANFLQFALAQGNKVSDVVQNPERFATALGKTLTDQQRYQIQHLDSPSVKSRLTSLSADAQAFIREVIKDGRYIIDWKDNPEGVAQRLKLDLKPGIAAEIRGVDLSDIIEPGGPHVMWIAVISVAVAVIVTAAAFEAEEMPVVDFSRIEKL